MTTITYQVTVSPVCTEWRLNGKLHREDGPAIEYANGDRFWFQNGDLHREDGPAIEYAGGTRCWYQNGELHREDGPAVEYASGARRWYRNGLLHRTDGPAVELENGVRYWYLNGEEMTEAEHRLRTRLNVDIPLNDIEKLLLVTPKSVL